MTSPILVTGGTGRLGRQVVPRLREAGRNVRVLSRESQETRDGIECVSGDPLKGYGVGASVDEIETILLLVGGPQGRRRGHPEPGACGVAGRSAARGVHLGHRGGRVPLGYFKQKLAAEQAVTDSGIP